MNYFLAGVNPIVEIMPVIILPLIFGFLAFIVFAIIRDAVKKKKHQKQLIIDKREQDRLRRAAS